jgi:CheY-like chemotaxis protein
MRLLLVEDELDIRGFLKHSLAEAGYQVEAAADGKTAEQFSIEGAFDILVVDLGLPDRDGISLILRLRQLGVKAPVLTFPRAAPSMIELEDLSRAATIISSSHLRLPSYSPACATCSSATARRPAKQPACGCSIWSWIY